MHGFPQAVKDLTATKGIRTTQGSRIFKDFVPTADAIVVERVKRAGAIVIGKTNTPEFGLGSNTYNDVFGRTLNAYDQTQDRGRIERRRRRRGRAAHAAGRRRHRSRRLAAQSRPPTTTSSASARRSAACRRKALDAFYAVHGHAGPDGAQRARSRDAAVGAGRLRPARAAVEPAGPGAVRRAARSATSRARASPGPAISAAICRSSRACSISARPR